MSKFIDIGSNLGDPSFRGKPRGSYKHPDDLQTLQNLMTYYRGVVGQILTGDDLKGSAEVLELAQQYPSYGMYSTAGCHPTRSSQAVKRPGSVSRYMEDLSLLISQNMAGSGKSGRIVAVGECGLDYDRLFLSSKEDQLKVFPPQLDLAAKYDLPLFLHSRTSEAHRDFVSIIRQHPAKLRGVVHSHTGTLEDAQELIDMGFYIGINGCSLKTEENLACVKALPLSSLLLETDCPYCDIRPSHASHKLLGPLLNNAKFAQYKDVFVPPAVKVERHQPDKMVKGRNEPCTIGQVAWCISALKGIPLEEVASTTYQNTVKLFGLPESP